MKPFKWIAASGVALTAGGIGTVVLFTSTFTPQGMDSGSAGGSVSCAATVNAPTGTAELDQEQLVNAWTIVQVGVALPVPRRGLVIALATALQESHLRNLNYGDRDSVGLFQQRPSAGWGSVAELTTPDVAATKFYRALLAVDGWEDMPLTRAAQAVQRSAFPLAYAKWESLAQTLVTQMMGPNSAPASVSTVAQIDCGTVVGASRVSGAVGVMLSIALAQQGKPYLWGGIGPSAFDCSGLVVYSWLEAGYRMTVRTADEMYRMSIPIPAGNEKPGDLLFGDFSRGVAGHVMIVVRPGVAVEAPHAGDVVKVISYNANTWRIGRLTANAFQADIVPG